MEPRGGEYNGLRVAKAEKCDTNIHLHLLFWRCEGYLLSQLIYTTSVDQHACRTTCPKQRQYVPMYCKCVVYLQRQLINLVSPGLRPTLLRLRPPSLCSQRILRSTLVFQQPFHSFGKRRNAGGLRYLLCQPDWKGPWEASDSSGEAWVAGCGGVDRARLLVTVDGILHTCRKTRQVQPGNKPSLVTVQR